MGVQDRFGESGPYEKLLEANGVTVDHIVENVKKLMGEK
jgi:transketolase